MSEAIAHDPVNAASNQNDQPTRIVAYIRAMLQELVRMTPAEAGMMLPYLIDLARSEAQAAEQRLSASPSR